MGGKFDFASVRFGCLAVENGGVANRTGFETICLTADGSDQAIFLRFLFVIDKLHLDQFMFCQSGVEGVNDLDSEAIFPDQNERFQFMGQAPEVFVLLAG